MNVLSLFDGIACGRVALERAGIQVDNYFASEIDKHAIKVAQTNYPDIIQLGDVNDWKSWDLPQIDLIMGGSPCQSISRLGDGLGLEGKSGVFFRFVECLEHYQPKYFLLENVQGDKKSIETITELMGVEPIVINSNIVSAQNRKRLYWTNIEFEPPRGEGPDLHEILEEGFPKEAILSPGRKQWLLSDKGQKTLNKKYAQLDPQKAGCLTYRSDASWNSNYVTRDGCITRLTPIEYERLQTLPDHYTNSISTSQRYATVGNGWTVDVIAHILRGVNSADTP